jgi:hypothetical protein
LLTLWGSFNLFDLIFNTNPLTLAIFTMKLTQLAQALAVLGSASAATYSNVSYVPSGSGYFYDGQIYIDLNLPNSGFSSFSIEGDAGNGFTFSPEAISGVYSPSGTPFSVTSDSTAGSIDISADIDFSSEDTAAEISLNGPLSGEQSSYVATFVVSLGGLPQLIEKRADQDFTITVTATSSNPSGETTTTPTTTPTTNTAPTTTPTTTSEGESTNTETEISTSSVTITSCSDNKCHTLTPVVPSTETALSTTLITITSCSENKCSEKTLTTGLTVVTEGTTVYTTYCPLTTTSAEADVTVTNTETVTGTSCVTYPDTTVTYLTTYVTTECSYYNTVTPTPAPAAPTTPGAPASPEQPASPAAPASPEQPASPASPEQPAPTTVSTTYPGGAAPESSIESIYSGAAPANYAGSFLAVGTLLLSILL